MEDDLYDVISCCRLSRWRVFLEAVPLGPPDTGRSLTQKFWLTKDSEERKEMERRKKFERDEEELECKHLQETLHSQLFI